MIQSQMIEIPFLPTEAFFALLWLLLRAAVWIRQRHIDWRREAVRFSDIKYLGLE